MPSCMTPYRRYDLPVVHDLDCGRCPNCTSKRASGWSFRLMEEAKHAASADFLTLTYRDGQASRSEKGQFLNLSKRDVQLFLKRLRTLQQRRYHSPLHIRYYAVGEYGSKTFRPHYHLIIFNANRLLYEEAWGHGDIHIGAVTGASVGYTLKYITKSCRIPLFKGDDRQKEFALMSKGLGSTYLTDAMVDWHHADLEARMYCNLLDGKKIAMPRYFKNKIYDETQRASIALAAQKRAAEKEKILTEKDRDTSSRSTLAAFQKQQLNNNKNDKL